MLIKKNMTPSLLFWHHFATCSDKLYWFNLNVSISFGLVATFTLQAETFVSSCAQFISLLFCIYENLEEPYSFVLPHSGHHLQHIRSRNPYLQLLLLCNGTKETKLQYFRFGFVKSIFNPFGHFDIQFKLWFCSFNSSFSIVFNYNSAKFKGSELLLLKSSFNSSLFNKL